MAAPATFYATQGGNDIWWRVEVPAAAIGAKTCIVPEAHFVVFQAPHDFSPFPWSEEDGKFTYPEHEGTAVWTRPDLVRAQHTVAMQLNGTLTAAEVDDNYLSRQNLNLFMRQNGYDEVARGKHLRAMAVHDRVICATPWLRDKYHKTFRKELSHIPDLFVCRNNVPHDAWPERDEGDGRLRIGWMGSPQHVRDVKLAARAMSWARDEGHEVIVMGHDFGDETGVRGDRALAETRAWQRIITRNIPWKSPGEYHRTPIPFDIGIAPLEYNEHTLGKSDCKALEYAISGAVPLLQNHPVYNAEWRHNETCLLASSPAEFEQQLRELCRSRALRERLVTAAQQYVREERGDKQLREEWEAAVA